MRTTLPSLAAMGLALAAAFGAAPATAEIVGPGRAVDGDTLEVAGVTVRLFGVDAPEAGQDCGEADGGAWECGAAATARLAALLAAGEARCRARERDPYGRVIGACTVGGADLGETLVREGLAWAYTQYSDRYAETEAAARDAGAGVWRGPAQVAWDWRHAGAWSAASGSAAPEGCAIKGSVNVKGDRVYHTPESPWYDRIVVDPARGQRWFCDVAEAEAAGWRPVSGTR
jgi:endonuclease YncB( thermonuclease family)